MLVAYVPVTPDPASVDGGVAGLGRVWERFGIDRVVLVVSPLARRECVERVRYWAGLLVGEDAVRAVEAPAPGDPDAVARLGKVLGDHGDGVVLVSAASRWLSAALALAASRRGCSIVYVSFYFGPWTGLVYPYTPWRLEPLYVLHGSPPARIMDGGAAARAPPAWEADVLLGKLPPLRAAVAEAARRLNAAYSGGCRRLRLSLPQGEAVDVDPGDPGSVAAAAEKLSQAIAEAARSSKMRRLLSLAASTGVAELRGLPGAGRLLVDTSLVYYGVHLYRWEGADIAVPECAASEVQRRFAEAVKAGRLATGGDAADAAAYLGLLDLLGSGAPMVPTPPGDCDTALVKTDPLLLRDAVLATADDGAYRYWSMHPASRLAAEVAKVSFNAWTQRWSGASNPKRVARLYYAFHQALVLLPLLAKHDLLPGFSAECVEGGDPGLEGVAEWLGKQLGLNPD